MVSIVISSGHSADVRGASGYIDEVDEARKVVDAVADILQKHGHSVKTFHDDTSSSQSENLQAIVDYHNAQTRDFDVSVHFNAYMVCDKPMGTEVLYVTAADVAAHVVNAIAKVGLINRGAKYRSDLKFLNSTEKPAVLIETLFVDSVADTDIYHQHFTPICRMIAASLVQALGGQVMVDRGRTIPSNQKDITASVFGGSSDPNCSAYDEDKMLNDTDLYVALPDRFEGTRPNVEVINVNNVKAVAEIWDVGPWNIDDPYWLSGERPQAESGTDMSGRKTNNAGIDLSPAMAKTLNIDGMGTVSWRFVT
jgi:N-acetylmuramoyl-L-alanine amidase